MIKNDDQIDIARLIRNHVLGLLSDSEQRQLDNWIALSEDNKRVFQLATDPQVLQESLTYIAEANERALVIQERLMSKFQFARHEKIITMEPCKKPGKISRYKWWISAALLVIIAGAFGIFYYTNKKSVDSLAEITHNGDLALLSTPRKEVLDLQKTKEGIVLNKGRSKIIKQNRGLLVVPNISDTVSNELFTLSTPRGSSYQITLSDGTRIWLNASSSVSFPMAFRENQRKISITGEVYFEVAEEITNGRKVPFIVDIGNKAITIEVLGTHFNISAYEDEPVVKATLLEGKINIKTKVDEVMLQPGQQADIRNDGIEMVSLTKSDTDATKAWQEGLFAFYSTDIKTIMREIGRWYNIDIVYEGNISGQFNFSGSRDRNLSEFIDFLKAVGLRSKIQSGRIVIYGD